MNFQISAHKMPLLSYFYLLPLLNLSLLFLRVSGQETVQQIVWNVPNGQEPDFSSTFDAGDSIPVSWNQYGNGSVEEYDALDLWVTTADYSVHPYAQLLDGIFSFVRCVSRIGSNNKFAENLSLNQGGSWTWTINIPTSQVQIDAKYVLRFKPISSPRSYYNASSSEVSSPGILILQAGSPTTTSSTSSSALNTSRTSAMPTTTGSNGLGTAAKAGIGIGVSAAALLSLGGFFAYFLLKRRKCRDPESQPAHGKPTESTLLRRSYEERVEKSANQDLESPAELPGDPHDRY